MCQVYERCDCGSLVWLKNHATTSDGDNTIHSWWNTCNKWDELEFTSEEWVNRIYSLLHDLNPIELNVKVVDNSLGFRVEVSL